MEKPDISVILEHYGATVPTRRGWFSIKCPFHDDSHASASANTDDGAFCCHACQMKGDGYAIIMNKEGVEFREAIGANASKDTYIKKLLCIAKASARFTSISDRLPPSYTTLYSFDSGKFNHRFMVATSDKRGSYTGQAIRNDGFFFVHQ